MLATLGVAEIFAMSLWFSASAVAPMLRALWDLDSGQSLHTLEGHTNGVRHVAITVDGVRAVSASEDNTLRVWDLDSRTCIASFSDDGSLGFGAVNSDCQTIVTAGASGRVHILVLEEPS